VPTFDYKQHSSWGNVGWLGSDEYYAFWGNVFAQKLAKYFEGKIVLDIGAGNGRVWEEALRFGLKVEALHLVDPALNVSPWLSSRPEAILHTTTVDNMQGVNGDVALFKQSIHHVYGALGNDLFNIIPCPLFINLSMPLSTEWPLSSVLIKKHKLSVLDVEHIVQKTSQTILETFSVDYPVAMKRDDWIMMLRQRFTSILHDCDNDFIESEMVWVEQNQPDTLKFNDALECTIFGKSI